MLSEQTLIQLREERAFLSIRDLAAKHHLSTCTVARYTTGIAGPKGSYKRKIVFVDEEGRWATIENALLILLAERKAARRKSVKLNRAIKALKDLVQPHCRNGNTGA